ncbi:hypothetical protein ACLOJK_013279 [Asimina triloba]
MSLSLLQGYSSAEEEAAAVENERFPDEDDSDDEDDEESEAADASQNSIFDLPKSSHSSLLPSALDAFSEVAGPPEFLNNAVATDQAPTKDMDVRVRHGGRKARKEKKDLPPGAVVEAKAQMAAIRDRVRTDANGNLPLTSAMPSQINSLPASAGEGKRVASAANPGAQDAAELLRDQIVPQSYTSMKKEPLFQILCFVLSVLCWGPGLSKLLDLLHMAVDVLNSILCGVPKTYSNARGMVCPICGDRPPPDPNKEPEKKKGSTIKDKEKSKRMKGQSTHDSWKSETEMQLRQQYD